MPTNQQIADQFGLLAKLMDIHQENSFKAKSYAAAAFAIERLPAELSEMERSTIPHLKGIGASSAQKIMELLDGGQLQLLDDLLGKTPAGILEMMQIKGLGPKKIATIWKEMEIETIGELLYACTENRLLRYKGFGEKTQKNVSSSIEFFLRHKGHFLWAELETYVQRMEQVVQERFPDYTMESCGSFKRQLPTLDALEWATNIPTVQLLPFLQELECEITSRQDAYISAKGLESVELRFYHSASTSTAVTAFRQNCSESFLHAWNEQFHHQWESVVSESEIFSSCSVPFIPSFLREDPSIIDQVLSQPTVSVIQPHDIKGIIHSHSDWSDGANTIEEMAVVCQQLGMEYLVISDHSKSAFYANGLQEERVKSQHQYIDELNRKLSPFVIFKSIECDILNDGVLDYSDALLSTFDLVIASVHSNLNMDQDKAMHRLLRAIEHPATTILGHPTGRLLLSRKGYPIDHEKIIDACISNRVAIEINAHPRRLDLDWSWVAKAQEKGAMLSINPDAHVIEGFKDVRYGVLAAQKGGLQKTHNLSSLNLNAFQQYLKENRKIK
ncbi:MAG: DNA polymerase/3'-5' exonuclease PolX [Bacteroidetes bacterium]|nr:DNA polymerase/3'-5' exonuclease PolX [Bacteroidota bacterium]